VKKVVNLIYIIKLGEAVLVVFWEFRVFLKKVWSYPEKFGGSFEGSNEIKRRGI
jgi:hypothetical protein